MSDTNWSPWLEREAGHFVARATGLAAALAVLVGCPSDDTEDDGADVAESGGETATWEVTQEVDASSGALLSVWGATPDDVRAVGGQIDAVGDAGIGAVLKRTDGAWESETLPDDTPVLNWIHGASGVVWSVGNAGAAIRLDAGAWVRDDTPVDVPLWGVWVLSADEAWAVGGDPFDTSGSGVLVHYVSGAWEEMPLPTLDRPAPAIFKVWGTSASNVHAVGDNGVILHYDGSAWTQSASGTTEDLISLWGTGPDEIVAVGGRSNGVLARFDGTAWISATVPMTPALNGVWMDQSGTAILAGERGTVLSVGKGAMEADIVDTPARLDVLHAAFGFDGAQRFSVGGTLQNPPPYTGVILETQ